MRGDQVALHWSADYVGLRYPGPRDCWPLVRDVYRAELGVELPRNNAGPGWKRRAGPPRDLDLVLFRQGDAESHVGLIAGRPTQMLHLPEGRASVVERFDDGTWTPRLAGVYGFDPALAGAELPLDPKIEPTGLLSVRKRPFLTVPGQDLEVVELFPGLTLLQAVRYCYPAATVAQLRDMIVRVDGREIPAEFWDTEITRAGQVLEIAPQPGAFPLGRLLAIVAIVTAAAFGQFYLGPLLAASLSGVIGTSAAAASAVTAVTTAVLTTAAAVLVNSLIPAPSAEKQRQVFTATGWENEFRPYGAVPMPAGYIRIAPPFCARPYVYFDENNKMHLVSLFLEGEGVLIKRKPRIGDTLLYKPEDEWADPDVPEFHFKGVRIESNEGRADDPPHTIYSHQVVDTDNMGASILISQEKVVRAVARDCTQFQFILAFPNGLTGFDVANGEPRNVSIFFRAEYREIGDTAWIHIPELGEVRKQQQTVFFVDITVEPPARGDFEVQIGITGTADFHEDTGDYTRNVVQWMQLYGHRPEYPLNFLSPKATTAIDVMATDQLQGILKSYNVEVSRECLHWNGAAWVAAETANPADFARLIEMSPNVNVSPKAGGDLVLTEYQELAEFCDDEGLEYNDAGMDSDALPSLRDRVLSAGRAQSRYTATSLGLFIDQRQSVVMAHVTPANGFQITREWERLPEIEGWIVNFADKSSEWVVKQRRIPFDGVVSPRKWMTLDLPGKTDPDEVYREAKKREYELRYQLNYAIMKAAVGWEGLTVQRGYLVVADDGVDRATMTALVTAVTTDGGAQFVTINENFERSSDQEYEVRFRRFIAEGSEVPTSPPADSLVRALADGDQTDNVLILSGAGALPEVGDLAIIGLAGLAGKLMKVSRVDGGEKDSAGLTLIRYAEEVFDLLDDLVIPAWDGRVGDIIGAEDDPPTITSAVGMLEEFTLAGIDGADVSGGLASEIMAFVRVTFTPFSGISHQMRWHIVGDSTFVVVSAPAGVGTIDTARGLPWANSYEVSMRSGETGAWGAWTAVTPIAVRVSDTDELRVGSDSIARRPF